MNSIAALSGAVVLNLVALSGTLVPRVEKVISGAFATSTTYTTLASQSFTHANQNPITGNWKLENALGEMGQILGNEYVGQIGFYTDMLYDDGAIAWPDDQASQGTLQTLNPGSGYVGSGYAALLVRASTPAALPTWSSSGAGFGSNDGFASIAAIADATAASNLNPGPNQFAQMTIADFPHLAPYPSSFIGPAVRIGFDILGNPQCYSLQVRDDNGFQLVLVNGGSRSFLGEAFGGVAAGQVIRIEANGNQITAKVNGSTILGPFTDNSITGGRPGIDTSVSQDVGVTNATKLSNFQAGAIGGGATSLPLTTVNNPAIYFPGSAYGMALLANEGGGLGLPTFLVLVGPHSAQDESFFGEATVTPHAGDVFKLAVIGNQLIVTQNGTQVLTAAADGSALSGHPGIGADPIVGVAGDMGWSSWLGQGISGTPGGLQVIQNLVPNLEASALGKPKLFALGAKLVPKLIALSAGVVS